MIQKIFNFFSSEAHLTATSHFTERDSSRIAGKRWKLRPYSAARDVSRTLKLFWCLFKFLRVCSNINKVRAYAAVNFNSKDFKRSALRDVVSWATSLTANKYSNSLFYVYRPILIGSEFMTELGLISELFIPNLLFLMCTRGSLFIDHDLNIWKSVDSKAKDIFVAKTSNQNQKLARRSPIRIFFVKC